MSDRLTNAPSAQGPAPAASAMLTAAERTASTVQELLSENQRLRRALGALTREAEKNQAIFQRFHSLELSLLDAGSLPELIERLVHQTRDILGLDEVTLILEDPKREIRSLLAANALLPPASPQVRLTDDPIAVELHDRGLSGPWLGPYRERHAGLFSGTRGGLGSIALLPLTAQGCLFGCLNLASDDPLRYTRRHGRDFHSRLASVASLCLQNAINRERLVLSGHTDQLTFWHNRRYLEARLPQEVARALRYREPLCCLLLDVDHFKRINDHYGHPCGDLVLREIADRIKGQLRSSDIAVRYGGEEFVVFLIHATEDDASSIAERIRRCVAGAPFDIRKGQPLRVTVSGGIAELRPGGAPEDPAVLGAAMLKDADAALYRAKAAGRDRIACSGRGLEAL